MDLLWWVGWANWIWVWWWVGSWVVMQGWVSNFLIAAGGVLVSVESWAYQRLLWFACCRWSTLKSTFIILATLELQLNFDRLYLNCSSKFHGNLVTWVNEWCNVWLNWLPNPFWNMILDKSKIKLNSYLLNVHHNQRTFVQLGLGLSQGFLSQNFQRFTFFSNRSNSVNIWARKMFFFVQR